MIHATMSDAVFLRSLKKFFLDLTTPKNIPTFFDFIEKPPRISGAFAPTWLSIIPRSTSLGTLADHLFYVHLFTNGDLDSSKMADLRDFLIENLVDLNQTDGRKRIPFYDEDWNVVFTGVLDPKQEIDFHRFDEGINMKTLPIMAYWGSK